MTVPRRDHDSSADQGCASDQPLGARAGGITAKLLQQAQLQIAPCGWPRLTTPGDGLQRRPQAAEARPLASCQQQVQGSLLSIGDVVPIQKRNGATGSTSLWVKEKRVGLIWVLEEIHEDAATVELDEDGVVTKLSGALGPIWGDEDLQPGIDVGKLVPRVPRQGA